MATPQDIEKTLMSLGTLRNSNQLNITEIENHRDDFKAYLTAVEPRLTTYLDNNSVTFDEFIFAARQMANGVPINQVQWLVQNDAFERYIDHLGKNGESTRICVNATMNKINQLFAQPLENNGGLRKIVSGLVVCKVQSGKTSNYVGLMVKAFTEGWNVVIVLTSNSDLLENQTASRIQKDFEKKADLRTAQLISYNQLPTNPQNHYWQVAKKNRAVLNRIYEWLDSASKHTFYGGARLRDTLRVLIIDDESDNASLNNNLIDKSYSDDEIYNISSALKESNQEEPTALTTIKEKYASYIEEFLEMRDQAENDEVIRRHVAELANRVDPENQTGNANEQLESFMTYCQQNHLPAGNVYDYQKNEIKQVFNGAKEYLKDLKSIFGVAASATVINRILKRILRTEDGFDFCRSAYLGYTATPYANILCESPQETIYPDFIQSIPAGPGYYGADQIFGSYNPDLDPCEAENSRPRLPIVYHFAKENDSDANGNPLKENSDEYQLSLLDTDPDAFNVGSCPELKKALAWFCCTAAIRKCNRANAEQSDSRKDLWTTMLINVITTIDEQNTIKEKVSEFFKDILSSDENRNSYAAYCRRIYSELSGNAPIRDFPDTRQMGDYPEFNTFEETLKNWVLTPAHLKVVALNAASDNQSDEDEYLNYENCSPRQYKDKRKNEEIAWVVVGGHKISRGLTMEGLTASYFKPSNAAIDTLFQMGRWFGYRNGYELLPRIWMTKEIMCKFKRMALYENMLHNSIIDNFNSGNSPKDPENYQIVYTLAGRLGKSDKFTGRKILRHNRQAPSVSITTGTISLNNGHIANVKGIVDNFFSDNWQGQYGRSNAGANSPIIENVRKDLVIELLNKLRSNYPHTSSAKIASVISAINNYTDEPELNFNIVLTGISEQEHGGNNTREFNFSRNISIIGPERQVSIFQREQFAAYAAPRAHVANQSFFTEEVLTAAAAEYRRNLEEKGENIPGNIRANDNFTEFLFEKQGRNNPVIQFFVLKPAAELQLNENDCLIAFSIFWPKLRMDKFIRYTCGDPLEELSDEERIDLICGILEGDDRAVTFDKICDKMLTIDEQIKGRKVYIRELLIAAAEIHLLQVFVPGQLYGNLRVPGDYVTVLQHRITEILNHLDVAVRAKKIVSILQSSFGDEYANCQDRLVDTVCKQYLANTPVAQQKFCQVPGRGPFFGKPGLTEADKSYNGMDYSLSGLFSAVKDFVCDSPWEVTLDQIKDNLADNGIEFSNNQDVSACIAQMSFQEVFRRFGFEECPFFAASKGIYRSQRCQLPELRIRIRNKIERILQERNGNAITLQEIKKRVPDQESLNRDLLGTNRVKDELESLVADGTVKTTGLRPILYYI